LRRKREVPPTVGIEGKWEGLGLRRRKLPPTVGCDGWWEVLGRKRKKSGGGRTVDDGQTAGAGRTFSLDSQGGVCLALGGRVARRSHGTSSRGTRWRWRRVGA